MALFSSFSINSRSKSSSSSLRVPCHHIQPRGRFIQYQQPGIVGDGCYDLQLRLHACREFLNLLIFRQPAFLDLLQEKGLVEILI